MKWTTDTSYNIKINWKYNGKQTEKKKTAKADNGRLSNTSD